MELVFFFQFSHNSAERSSVLFSGSNSDDEGGDIIKDFTSINNNNSYRHKQSSFVNGNHRERPKSEVLNL